MVYTSKQYPSWGNTDQNTKILGKHHFHKDAHQSVKQRACGLTAAGASVDSAELASSVLVNSTRKRSDRFFREMTWATLAWWTVRRDANDTWDIGGWNQQGPRQNQAMDDYPEIRHEAADR